MNVIDILVVWYLIYKLIMLVRGTRAIQVLKGIGIIIVVRIVSDYLGLNTVSWLMNQVITYGVIAAIVIFQPEVRRGLEHLGRGSLFKKGKRTPKDEKSELINAFDKAIQYMSKRRIGALITIERDVSLDSYIATGIPIEAKITGELLINIFIPNTPLHDGAVIVRGGRVQVACAYLPLSESTALSKEYGTRHRAAVGISEVSDAVTIIVSEETGDVSFTLNNELIPHLEQEEYLALLKRELTVSKEKQQESLLQQFLDGVSKGAKR